MLTAILMGVLRHFATTAGGALLTLGIDVVNGLPVVHNVEAAVTGSVLVVGGMVTSALQKANIKTITGPDYSTLNK